MAIQWKARWGMLFFVLPLAAGGAWAAAASFPAESAATRSTTYSNQTLPAALRPAFYKALAKDAGAAYRLNKAGCAVLQRQKLKACFDARGAHFTGAAPLSLHLFAFGRHGKLARVEAVKPDGDGNEVRYKHGNLIEWWRVLPVGFEQGFAITRRQAGHGDLQLLLASNIKGQMHGDSLGWGKLRYGHLVVTDAKGKHIPASLSVKENRILIQINDRHAHYPLTVDPLIWIEQKIAPNNLVTNDLFGSAVAISGTTALIGAISPTVNGSGKPGTVYVYTESDGSWNLTGKLTASGGTGGDEFGSAIALDGTTTFIGAPDAIISPSNPLPRGAVYVFSDSSGTWTQTQKSTAEDGVFDDLFGTSVAVSGDTLIVGAPGATINSNSPHQGVVYVFTNNDGAWTQQQKLVASNGAGYDQFGKSLAISGATALIGAPYTSVNGYSGVGTAYVFTEANGSWSQKAVLEPNDPATWGHFSIALALAGKTALIGAPNSSANSVPGTVYVFTDSGGNWFQSQKLKPHDSAPYDQFGASLALNGDAFVTNVNAGHVPIESNFVQGAIYVFSDSSGIWKEERKLIAHNGKVSNYRGNAVALSKHSALLGEPEADNSAGAAYIYGMADLDLADDAPAKVIQGNSYTSQVIATNLSSTTSPAIAISAAVPAGADFVSADATKGSCNEKSGIVNCDFGAISGNGGTESATITFNAIGTADSFISNVAAVKNATPPLTASAATQISAAPPPPPPPPPNNGGGGFGLFALVGLLGLAFAGLGLRLRHG